MKPYQIKKLVNRITRKSQSNNDTFIYYGNNVTLQSGTSDFAVVSVKDFNACKNVMEFDVDYLTKELNITFYDTEETYETLVQAFKNIYPNMKILVEDEE